MSVAAAAVDNALSFVVVAALAVEGDGSTGNAAATPMLACYNHSTAGAAFSIAAAACANNGGSDNEKDFNSSAEVQM